MPTLFTRIIDGELPGHFVWRDDRCVAFLSINPLRDGHTLVVPREEVDHWLDAGPDLMAHLSAVGQVIGRALMAAYAASRVSLIVAGLEVPHLHLHLIQFETMSQLDFRNAARSVPAGVLADHADRIRRALVERGHAAHAVQ